MKTLKKFLSQILSFDSFRVEKMEGTLKVLSRKKFFERSLFKDSF